MNCRCSGWSQGSADSQEKWNMKVLLSKYVVLAL
jgi:hypothetical protein